MSQSQYTTIIDALFEVISSGAPTQTASRYIATDVMMEMDNITTQGFRYWRLWVEYMWRFGGFDTLTLTRTETRLEGDWARVSGTAAARRADKPPVIHDIHVNFRFNRDKIVEIQTTRHNYVAAFGAKIQSRFLFRCMLLHMLAWARIARKY